MQKRRSKPDFHPAGIHSAEFEVAFVEKDVKMTPKSAFFYPAGGRFVL